MKGILLAGGSGSRMKPLSTVMNKQLLAVYNKPLIYYPLAHLMRAGIREILLVTSPAHSGSFERLLGDGSQLGISISHAVQERPRGIAADRPDRLVDALVERVEHRLLFAAVGDDRLEAVVRAKGE